jgi:hypothetical protein
MVNRKGSTALVVVGAYEAVGCPAAWEGRCLAGSRHPAGTHARESATIRRAKGWPVREVGVRGLS